MFCWGDVCLFSSRVSWFLCVWTIWRDVKLLTWWSFGFQFQFSVFIIIQVQGLDAWFGSHPPTKTLPFHGDMTKGRLCHVPAISTPFCSTSICRTWGPAKPRTGKSFSPFLLQPIQFNYGWYELAQLSGYGDGSFSMLFRSLHRPIPVRRNGSVFLHVRCFPPQNSQWQFWASVCLFPVVVLATVAFSVS